MYQRIYFQSSKHNRLMLSYCNNASLAASHGCMQAIAGASTCSHSLVIACPLPFAGHASSVHPPRPAPHVLACDCMKNDFAIFGSVQN